MENQKFEIIRYTNKYREQLLQVWEQSVLATHSFLKPADFEAIKEMVRSIDFNTLNVYCLLQHDQVVGFLGTAEQKVEMLFLSPIHLGKGLGRQLMDFAIQQLGASKVDVNEQNIAAVAFYQKFGFTTYERTDKDDQGYDYPILRMRLEHLGTTRPIVNT